MLGHGWRTGLRSMLSILLLGAVPSALLACLMGDILGPLTGLYSRKALDEAKRAEAEKGAASQTTRPKGDNEEETMEWLNLFVSQIWPRVAKFVEAKIRDVLPTIQSKLPSQLGKIDFETCTIGDRPLKFGRIVARKVPGQYDGRILPENGVELEIGVEYKSNIDVVLTTAVARVGIANLSITGDVSIFMRPLLNEPPFFGGLEVVFTNPPALNVDFRGVAGVVDVPGLNLKKIIFDAIDRAVAGAIVIPNRKGWPMGEDPKRDASVVKSPAPIGVLRLKILRAKDLIAADMTITGKSSDPYVRVKAGAQIWQTPTIRRNLNPEWTEGNINDFLVHSDRQWIQIDIMDEDRAPLDGDDSLGSINRYPISRLRDKAGTGEVRLFLEAPPGVAALPGSQLVVEVGWLSLAEAFRGSEVRGPNKYLLSFRVNECTGLACDVPGAPYIVRAREKQQAVEDSRSTGPGWSRGQVVAMDVEVLRRMRKLHKSKVDPSVVAEVLNLDAGLVRDFLVEGACSGSDGLVHAGAFDDLSREEQERYGQSWIQKLESNLREREVASNPQFEEVLQLLLPASVGTLVVELVTDPAARKAQKLPEVAHTFEVNIGKDAELKGPFDLQAHSFQLPVQILSARGLRAADFMGKSDPYCVCKLKGAQDGDRKLKTDVIKQTLEPIWNFRGGVADFAPTDDSAALSFKVWDQDTPPKPDDFLGKAVLPIEQFWPQGFEGELKLQEARSEAYLKVKIPPASDFQPAACVQLHGSLSMRRLEVR